MVSTGELPPLVNLLFCGRKSMPWRLRAGGFLGVQAVGLDLFIGCHYGSNGSGRGEPIG